MEKADLTLPSEYQDEVMGAELLAHITNYYQATAALKSARNMGDHARAEQLYKTVAFSRLAVAVIQHDFPNTKEIADELGKFRAKQARQQRRALLEEEKKEK